MFETVKRMLVGRPLATSEQEHQRLTKTVALAVFSSDAISSTAYATEEILFVTAVGRRRASSSASTPRPDRDRGRAPARDRRHVVPPDDLRLSEGRRARTSSAARTTARCRRSSPAPRSSSTTSSPWRCRCRRVSPPSSRSRSSTTSSGSIASRSRLVIILLISLANLRGIKESGRLFAIPTYGYIVAWSSLLVTLGLTKSYFGWFGGISPVPFDAESGRGAARDRRHTRPVPHPQGLLVGRGRARRHRGDLRRRARVPPAGGEERGARRWRSWARSSARCSSACRCSRTNCTRIRATT